jgi:hypothetical protein
MNESRCHTCESPFRAILEWEILKGWSKRSIADRLPADENGHKIDRRSLSLQYKKHMDITSPFVPPRLKK